MLPLDEFLGFDPALEPMTFECMGRTIEELGELVRDVISIISDRLHGAGVFQEAEMLLIVPEALEGLPEDLSVATSNALDKKALLLTLSIGGHSIIHIPDEMSYEDWLFAIMRGERPRLVVTMPWAQARFINWGVVWNE